MGIKYFGPTWQSSNQVPAYFGRRKRFSILTKVYIQHTWIHYEARDKDSYGSPLRAPRRKELSISLNSKNIFINCCKSYWYTFVLNYHCRAIESFQRLYYELITSISIRLVQVYSIKFNPLFNLNSIVTYILAMKSGS